MFFFPLENHYSMEFELVGSKPRASPAAMLVGIKYN